MAKSTNNAISTYGVFLMYKAGSGDTYTELCPIKDYPDLGGTPETLETTCLSDGMATSVLGIQQLDNLDFTANYTLDEYTKLNQLKGQKHSFAVWFGGDEAPGTNKKTPTGDDGKFAFDGELSVYVSGGGVNEVVDMTISIAASTPIALVE